jgi:acyl-CoA reductase-like NAD-dependent aldehyde dehydrogenase
MAELNQQRIGIDVARGTIEVRNPATLEKIAEVPSASSLDVSAAVLRARQAQKEWQTTSFAHRARILYRLRDGLLDEQERLADILTNETGGPRAEVYGNELFYLCDVIGYWARRAPRYLKAQRITPHLLKGKKVLSTYAPIGVVGIISPWNFPLILSLGEALPALMAGNAVVLKPSELTPLSVLFGAELAANAGIPENILQVVVGGGAAGEALIDCADMISFIGSAETGKRVMRRAAERLIPVSLELGGKDPMIVLKDADIERAAGACVWGALMNAGQACTSIERVYVEAPVYSQFVDNVVAKVRALRQGASENEVELGSMTSETQLKKIEAQITEALAKGAKLLSGGRRNPSFRGLYFEPTVLVDVDHRMTVMTDETFGPIIPIMKVKDADEALQLANDSRYGLGGSVFTRDKAFGRRFAQRMHTGSVCVNDSLVNFIIPDAPMGGTKDSGFGYRHGAEGIRKFCRQKTIVIDRFGLKKEFPWFPSSHKKTQQMRLWLTLLCRSGWTNKLGAVKRFFVG